MMGYQYYTSALLNESVKIYSFWVCATSNFSHSYTVSNIEDTVCIKTNLQIRRNSNIKRRT